MTIIVASGTGFISGDFAAENHAGRYSEDPGMSLQTNIVVSGEYRNYYEKMYSIR